MTESEAKWEYCMAIDLIKKIKTEETHERYIDRHKAFDMAIQALEEIQQYRAIGSVKEIKIREAQFVRLSEGYLNDLTLLREYQSIGTVEECTEAVKNIEHFYMLGRTKAIDEFAELFIEKDSKHIMDYNYYETLREVAEKMKEGGNDA